MVTDLNLLGVCRWSPIQVLSRPNPAQLLRSDAFLESQCKTASYVSPGKCISFWNGLFSFTFWLVLETHSLETVIHAPSPIPHILPAIGNFSWYLYASGSEWRMISSLVVQFSVLGKMFWLSLLVGESLLEPSGQRTSYSNRAVSSKWRISQSKASVVSSLRNYSRLFQVSFVLAQVVLCAMWTAADSVCFCVLCFHLFIYVSLNPSSFACPVV